MITARLSVVTEPLDIPLEPLSDRYGFDRGTPLDRRYIEEFLNEHRNAIRGSVLEVEGDMYTRMFGAGRVATCTVVDIDSSNPRATLVADLSEADSLAPETYDCIILTQTLHLLRRPGRCLENCYGALRPAGVLLATAPSLSRVSPSYPDGDFWRFTQAGMTELVSRRWPGEFSVRAFGNLRTCVGFLIGEVVEDLPEAVLDHADSRFPLTIAVEARKP